MNGRTSTLMDLFISKLKSGEKGIILCPNRHRSTHVAKQIRQFYRLKAKARAFRNRGMPIHAIFDELSDTPRIGMIPNNTITFGVEVWK